MQYRIESDSIGSRQVPMDAYYGVQSLRGSENFRITGHRLRPEFIESLAQIKKACAIVNGNIGAGIAVMGAFSLIRFRSAPGTAKEIIMIL